MVQIQKSLRTRLLLRFALRILLLCTPVACFGVEAGASEQPRVPEGPAPAQPSPPADVDRYRGSGRMQRLEVSRDGRYSLDATARIVASGKGATRDRYAMKALAAICPAGDSSLFRNGFEALFP